MNHFKCILDRTSRYKFRRLQSSLSVSNSKIQIPTRIKRDPTDILRALERTIPKDSNMHITKNYIYHNDPYLLPLKKLDYRIYALSYESGKKTAMWIHKEHSDLFPKHLSNPEIEAFKPLPKYTDKNQVSEEILLHAISQCLVSHALHIYKLLDANVSNETKQLLLELLCFYNNESNSINNLLIEQWFSKPKEKYTWQYKSEINELYNFLITQDYSTATAAHNIMICGLTKYSRIDEAWLLYQECKKKDIPLNLTTWNYIIILFGKIFNIKEIKIYYLFDILKSMNEKKIKPNIQTLNAILNVIIKLKIKNHTDVIKHLLLEFKNINIKFSLATYYYVMQGFTSNDNNKSHDNFIQILHKIKNKRFTIQDPMDHKFFKHAMYLALKYGDKEAGNMIHELLLIADNYKFISNLIIESDYYNSYITLLLLTSTIEEFFESYEKLVPNLYVPTKRLLIDIISELKFHDPHVLIKYIPRLWSDINIYCNMDLSVKLTLISLMKMDILSADSPLRTIFINAAWNCWNNIKKEIKMKGKTNTLIETARIAYIAIILLDGDFVEESIEVLTYINKPELFVPTMNKNQINQLFDKYISKQCVKGCFLVLDYSVNSGFSDINQMVIKLHNLPEFTNVDRDKLINLVGEEVLHILDTKQLN